MIVNYKIEVKTILKCMILEHIHCIVIKGLNLMKSIGYSFSFPDCRSLLFYMASMLKPDIYITQSETHW